MAYDLVIENPGRLMSKVDGIWSVATAMFVKHQGGWKRLTRMNIKHQGSWEAISWALPKYTVFVTSDESDLDVYAAINSDGPVDFPVHVVIDVPVGITTFSSSVSHGAIYNSAALPTGSTARINVRGSVFGCTGPGGDSATWYANQFPYSSYAVSGLPGGVGGSAVTLDLDYTIDNDPTTGKVYGGGGGGGGGGMAAHNYGAGTLSIYGGGSGAGGAEAGLVRSIQSGGNPADVVGGGYGSTGGAHPYELIDGGAPRSGQDSLYFYSGGRGGHAGPAGSDGDAGSNATRSGGSIYNFASPGGAGSAGAAVVEEVGQTITWLNVGDVKP